MTAATKGSRRTGLAAYIVTGLVLIAGMALGAGTASAAQVGTLRVLSGEVTITRAGQEISVSQASTLEDGDKVQTHAGSRAYVHINEGGEALVQEYTVVEVNDIGSPRKRSPFVLAVGSLRSRIAKWVHAEPFVQSATATIGIKGTDFITWVKKPNATEFVGVDGLIECTSRSRPEYNIRIGKKRWGEIVEGQKPNDPIEVPDALWAAALHDYAFPAN